MRYWSIVLLLVFPLAAAADEPGVLRPLDELSSQSLNTAIARSAVVRALVDTLEGSDLIVHIVSSRHLPAGLAGTTRFVTSRGGRRYVRITIGADLAAVARTAILGHELQHALEVAQSRASNVEDVRALFEGSGMRDGDLFETRAALAVEKLVRKELRARTLPTVSTARQVALPESVSKARDSS